ncbi:MAG: molybdopterin-dependent oxidoreductase, partial [Proteobacteria bacterium]|nr:molybdopterin-dependent oxidoreductase [Pseudomonadota bacterium]
TNTLTEYLYEEDVIIAYKMNGNILPAKHGFPLRLIIPKLYAWKSAKYVSGFEFLNENRAGYWEERGYHMHADPWKNERYNR